MVLNHMTQQIFRIDSCYLVVGSTFNTSFQNLLWKLFISGRFWFRGSH